MTELIYAAIDLETTGLKAGLDEIIEVGIVRCTPDRVLDTYSTLVRPMEMPPLRVQRLTGITPDDLRNAPTWDDVAEQVEDMLNGAVLVGHNVEFDARFLQAAGIELGRQVDTLELSRIVDPVSPSHRLGELCQRYGVIIPNAHRALDDAEAARQVFLKQRERYADLPSEARSELAEIVAGADFFWSSGQILREWETQTPRLGDTETARRPVEAAGRPADVSLPTGTLLQLTERAFASVEDQGFERREEQLAMARDVANALQYGGSLVVEAGTGTGKSLAYLVPAALWALKLGRTVMIATNTINLQQQLVGNDVELARRLIRGISPEAADALEAAVVKGRGNYLCQERLDTEIQRAGRWEEPAVLARVATWRHVSVHGDRAEMRLPPEHGKHWPEFNAERMRCLSDRTCEYTHGGKAGSCFVQQVQRLAQRSHIVIVNHSLLAVDLLHNAALVPDAAVVIVDEAHLLEDAVTDQLSVEITESRLMETIMELADHTDEIVAAANSAGLSFRASTMEQAVEAAELALAEVFERIAELVSLYRDERDQHSDTMKVTSGVRNSREWSELEERWAATHETLTQLISEIDQAVSSAEPDAERPRFDVVEAIEQLRERLTEVDSVVSRHSETTVAWVKRQTRRSEQTALHSAPLSVAEALQPLWTQKHSTILTGATLGSSDEPGAEFRFLRERLGVDEDADERVYGSPFDYEQHARVFLPIEAHEPNDLHYDDFVAMAVKQLALAAGGQTMVLFRSYRALNAVTRQVAGDLELAGLSLVRQGRDGSAARMVEALRSDPRTVVFGVQALWTGVDIPGPALSQLIIARLPFDPPTDPVLKARADQYDNPFLDFALPNAVIQFRQGVGRLIRAGDDRGAIVILDGRMLHRDYGATFRRALPPAPVLELPLTQVAAEVKKFLPLRETTT